MKHHMSFRQHNIRTFLATLLSYVLLTSQLAPMALAANAAKGSAPRNAAAKNAEVVSEKSVVMSERFAPVPVPLAAPAAVAPIITATKVDSFADSDGDGKAEPGEIITYSVTLTNTGPDPALNLTLNDTVDANTTLIGGSATSTPIGVGDAFSVLGNVRIQVPDGGSDLLANDNDPQTGTNAGLTITTLAGDNSAPFAGTSVNGGQVTATTGDGSFQYNPAPGFTGVDTFTYIVSDSNGPSQPVTVTLTVSGMIWFVNSGATCSPVCDGRLTSPFIALTGAGSYDAVAVDEAGDNIFLYAGPTYANTGALTLLNNQKIIGQGTNAGTTLQAAAGVTLPPHSDALPALNGNPASVTVTSTAAGIILTVANNNELRGFTISNTTGAKLQSAAFGTLTVSEVALSGSGQALNLDSGTLAATFTSITSSSSTAQGIFLDQIAGSLTSTAGTTISGSTSQCLLVSASTANMSFGNTSCSGGTIGVSLQSNTAGTRTFGTLSISNNSGIGFLSTAGGNSTVTGATLIPAAAQTAPVGTGIDIQSLAAGTAATFAATTVNKGNAGTGVNLGTIATPNLGNVTFNSLAITTANGSGLVSAANTGTTGQINVTTNAGSISSTGGPAINITKTVAPATPISLNFTTIASTNSTTQGINLDRVSGNLTAATTTIGGATGPAGIGISVTNTSAGGTMNFGNTTSNLSAGTGVNLGSNAGAVTFADLDIAPDPTAAALVIANSSGTTTSSSGTISTTDAPAISVTSSPLSMTLNSVSADNTGDPDSAVSLTTASGSLNMQGGTLTGGTGAVFLVSGGNPTVTYSGSIVQNSAARVVDIQSTTGGAVTFNTGTITGGASSTGVNINAVNGNVTFSNGLTLGTSIARMTSQAVTITSGTGTYSLGNVSIFTNNVQGLGATNADGTLNITTGTVNTTNATAINIDGPVGLTTLGITLTRVDSTGGASNGINLVDTNGTFTIAGTGTAGSGGTIASKTGVDANFATQGTGVFLSNAVGVSLTRMQMNDFSNFAIRGNTVSGFSLTNSVINGTNGSAGGATDESAIRFDGLTGSATISNNNITHGFEFIVKIFNTSGSLNRLTMESNTFGVNNVTLGGDAVQIFASGTATVNVTANSNTFTNAREDLFNAVVTQTANMDLVFRLNTLSNNHTNKVGAASNVLLFSTSIGTVTYDMSCNKMTTGATGTALGAAKGVPDSGSGGTMTGTMNNNRIGLSGVVGSGSQFTGIFASALGSGTHTTAITNNIIYRYNEEGIFLKANDPLTGGNAVLNATVTGNQTLEPDPLAFAGIWIVAGSGSGVETHQVNVVLGSATNAALKNDFSPGDPANFGDVFFQEAGSASVINLSRAGSASGTVANVVKDDNLNPATTAVTSSGTVNLVVTTPATPPAVAACVPPAAPNPIDENISEPTEAPGEINTPGAPSASSAPASASESITDRPFVSSPRQDAAKLTESQKLVVTSGVGARTFDIPTSKSETKPATKPSSNLISPTPPVIVGNNLTWNVGTLPAGQSVTITFQVQVENPYIGPPQVSNQGTVTADGGISVLTDDPSVVGANNPTVTPIDVPPDIFVRDARAAEPTSGSTNMVFTVALSTPATSTVSVNFATADEPAGPGKAVAGIDYTSTNGTATFTVGQQVQSINVPILSDADASEPDETFLVNLSSPTNGIIVDGQAIGTITVANPPGTTLISELRTSGPGGTNDDFVEIYNNTNSPLTVTASDASAGYGLFKAGATSTDTPVLIGTIPNGTVIPARGHYLLVGSAYSLTNYGGTGAAAGNLTMTADIENDRNVALFTTANLVNISSTNRLDAVGFGLNTNGVFDLFREGSTLPTAAGSTSEYSFVRKLATGTPQDTNDNLADFQVVTTTPATPIGTTTPSLGAAGPENLASPIQRNATIKASLIDTGVASSAPPNRVRDTTPDIPNNSTFGTLDFRRKFTNNTGGSVTRLRFRIVDVTTTPQPAGIADLRARTSGNLTVTITGGSMISVIGSTLELPPAQPNGGGQNSTLSAGTVTLGSPLAAGASINMRFLMGVQQNGSFRFFINVEALP